MFIRNVVLSGLVALAAANTPQHANYDDIKVPPAVDLHPVGTYKGLTYNAWAVVDGGLDGEIVIGINPTSGANVVATEIVSTVLHGSNYIVTESGSSFTPQSINFGCVLATVESALGVPVSCSLVVKGFNKADEEVAQQTFSFAPNGLLKSDMTKAVFNKSFRDVFKITVSNKSQTGPLTAFLYDDFDYLLGHKY